MGGSPTAGWFMMDNPIKMDDNWGYPLWLRKLGGGFMGIGKWMGRNGESRVKMGWFFMVVFGTGFLVVIWTWRSSWRWIGEMGWFYHQWCSSTKIFKSPWRKSCVFNPAFYLKTSLPWKNTELLPERVCLPSLSPFIVAALPVVAALPPMYAHQLGGLNGYRCRPLRIPGM